MDSPSDSAHQKTRIFSLDQIGPLIFGSGLCALVYQVVWLRELRLVFGASTAASSAVLAIFMGGLGLGGAILGKRVDGNPHPIRFYAHLEILIAASAAVTPFLLDLIRFVYIQLGGSMAMGIGVASMVRLFLSALVLGVPTFLMGGTLPAAAKGVVSAADDGRRHLAWLYGLNTMGAVIGVVAATFFMLEVLGTRNTLWTACLVNALIGLAARAVDRHPEKPSGCLAVRAEPIPVAVGDDPSRLPPALVFTAAALTGFSFFIMELVWYRTLGPLLGGSTYTFGLILAVALAGIGTGGMAYAMRRPEARVTLGLFALTIGLEAFFLILPFAVGDWVAVFAGLITPLGGLGMAGRSLGWAMVAGFVIFPAAVVSGFQFPLLIGLLGQGGRHVGRDIGFAYAWNTVGAIAGAIAGGFGFLPLFTARGVWQGIAVCLVLLCLAAIPVSWRLEGHSKKLAASLMTILVSVVLVFSTGPTAAWRHSPIGAGRASLVNMNQNQIQDILHRQRRIIQWESEGVEASVGLDRNNGLAFVVNGKVDGNAKGDAGTQVMLGLVSAALHPAPRRSLVIGLGTGSSAGWLARVESMEQVDVSELEPDIRAVARACAAVNHRVMDNPKVSVIVSDAREVLLTGRNQYDLIVSEPSNPYRAGIASLYTREFYEAVKQRLNKGGLFTQWVQAYEIDAQTMGTIYATMASVFPFVETWQTQDRDLILIGAMENRSASVTDLRRRLAKEPFQSALMATWGAVDLEGFLARFIARPAFARKIADQAAKMGLLNTDDRMLIEFGFARTLGKFQLFGNQEIFKEASRLGLQYPSWVGPEVDRDLVMENRLIMYVLGGGDPAGIPELSEQMKRLAQSLKRFQLGDYKGCLSWWRKTGMTPRYPLEIAMVAEAMADRGDSDADRLAESLGVFWPMEAVAIRGRLLFRTGAHLQSYAAFREAFVKFRTDPWANLAIMQRAMGTARDLARRAPELAEKLYALFTVPFAVRILDGFRLRLLLDIGSQIDFKHGAEAVRRFEPHIPWTEKFLRYRYLCYEKTGDPLAGQARADLDRFFQHAPVPFRRALGEP